MWKFCETFLQTECVFVYARVYMPLATDECATMFEEKTEEGFDFAQYFDQSNT